MQAPGVLGAWEDRPQRVADADVTGVQLDSRAAFVLTRIDGAASIAELCAMSGLTEEQTVEVLTRLVQLKLVSIQKAPAAPARPAPASGPRTTQTLADEARALAESAGPRRVDLITLKRYGRLGYFPEAPARKLGDILYTGFQFEKRELLEQCDLQLDQKRDILYLFHNLDRLDHFELLDMAPSADRREIKKAYFAFSKRFHPDTFFRKNLGVYAERLQKVFKFVTDVHDRLQADTELRETYARVIDARNKAFAARIDADRLGSQAEKEKKEQDTAAARKAELAARLSKTQEQRRGRAENPMVERLAKAEAYYKEGMAQYSSEKFLQAANSLQLALTYDPKNDTFRQAYERVNEKARQVRAEGHWKRGYMFESVGQTREAMHEYKQAVELWARADYLAHTAEMLWQNDEDLTRAAELARQATELAPQNVDYLLTLGKIYEQAKLVKRAIGVFEKALKLDADNDSAKRQLKALKRLG